MLATEVGRAEWFRTGLEVQVGLKAGQNRKQLVRVQGRISLAKGARC